MSVYDEYYKMVSKKEDWGVIVNPKSGGKTAQRKWRKISSALIDNGFRFYEVFTEYPRHAESLIKELLSEGYENIILVGGDGTMNEAVNGILNQNILPPKSVTLAVIPVGTGNDWGRTHYIDNNIDHSIKVISGWKTMMQDIGIVEYFLDGKPMKRYFDNMADVGFGTIVAKKVGKISKKGLSNKWTYLYSILTQLFKYKNIPVKFNIDSQIINDIKLFNACIAIGKFNGNGILHAPNAIPNDGLFDITIVNDIKHYEVIRSVKQLYDGSINNHKNVISLRGRNITIDSDQEIFVEVDGEVIGHGPLKFSILPEAIQIITGK